MANTAEIRPMAPTSSYQQGLRCCDALVGVAALIWMAEALVRLPFSQPITVAFYGYFSLRFLMTAPRFISAVGCNWVMLLYPGICLLSVIWSLVPVVSIVAAIELSFTVLIGIFLGSQFGLRTIALLLLWALGLTMLSSAANLDGALGKAYSYYGGFLGIYTNKNALGQRGALLLATCIWFLLREPNNLLRFASLCLAALTGWLLILTQSATSIIVSVALAGVLAIVICWQRLPRQRPYLVLACGFIALAAIASLIGLKINPVNEILAAFGKNSSLTGRTFLWQTGIDRIAEAPVLGLGYLAYWNAPQFAQETQAIAAIYGETVSAFHNFVIEVLVASGPVGLLGILILAATPVMRLRRVADPMRIWALAMVSLLVFLSLLGSSFFRPHEISLLLVVMIGAAARHRRYG